MAPPRKMRLSEVPAYLDREHNIEGTRQTVYNWAQKGKKGTLLQTTTKAGQLYTTENWVDEFVESVG